MAQLEETLTYEAATARLEAIIARLDSGEAGLRETLELCREGRALVEFCAGELEAVGKGLEELKTRVAERFAERLRQVRLLVPYDEGRILAELYELGAPIDERLDTPEGVVVLAQLPQREVPRFAPFLVAEPAARARGR